MRLPIIEHTGNASLKVIGAFHGLNKNLVCQDTEFFDMKNISTRFYPAIGTRERRGKVSGSVENPGGLYYKNGLFWIDGEKAFYKGSEIGAVSAGEKQLVGMGAYIVIWPDKAAFNTHTGEWTQIEELFLPEGEVMFDPLSKDSAFTKISVAGIEKHFKKGDAVQITGCSNAEFNKTTVLKEVGSGYVVVTGALSKGFKNTGITFRRNAPDMDYICESNNRLWGCSSKNHEIYASKLGDPLNWNVFEGSSTDSYAVTVGTDEDFTGCTAHLGNILFFKENAIHKLMGAKPASFQITPYTLPGIRKGCERSIQIIKETLYYVGRDGVYGYDGATPYCISRNLGEVRLSEAVAGQQDGFLYISANDGSKRRLYVYDTETRLWSIEDETDFRYAVYGNGVLYYADGKGQIASIKGDRDETIDWYLESGDIREQTMNNKYISKLLFNIWLERKARVDVYVRWDDEPLWEHKGSITAEWNQTYSIPMIPKRCNKFRFRLAGKGQFKLIGIGRYIEGSTEVLHGIVFH